MPEVTGGRWKDAAREGRQFWGFGYLIAVLAGATLAVVFGLMAGLSAGVTLMMMGGGAILLAGILFTILEVLRLGRSPQSAPPRQELQEPGARRNERPI